MWLLPHADKRTVIGLFVRHFTQPLYVKYCRKNKNSVRIAHNILTERKIEYLALAVLGYENLEIEANLVVSRSTVKKTLENVFEAKGSKQSLRCFYGFFFVHFNLAVFD